MSSAVLLLWGPDRPGIVAAVAACVHEFGGNIVHADQHTDAAVGMFLQRVEFTADDDRGFEAAIAPVADRFELDWRVHRRSEPATVGVLVSRQGHVLYDLLSRHALGELGADVAVVISNHPDHGPVADRFGIPFHHCPIGERIGDGDGNDERSAQELQVRRLLNGYGVDVVVLARYMQILSADFVAEWHQRVINIHHSFLPAFVGARPYHQAYERGVKLIGATAHYATVDLDEGPIIEQDVARVSHRDEVPDLVRKGRDLEKVVLARAVRLHVEHRVLAYGNRTVIFD